VNDFVLNNQIGKLSKVKFFLNIKYLY